MTFFILMMSLGVFRDSRLKTVLYLRFSIDPTHLHVFTIAPMAIGDAYHRLAQYAPTPAPRSWYVRHTSRDRIYSKAAPWYYRMPH